MYYRVAIQVDAAPTWQWKSMVLSSLDTLFHFLRLFRALPYDRLRVSSSSERVGLAEQLEQENQGLSSPSVTATQFRSGANCTTRLVLERNSNSHAKMASEFATCVKDVHPDTYIENPVVSKTEERIARGYTRRMR